MVQGQKKGNEKLSTGHFHEDLHSMLQWFLWLQSQWLTASHIPADTKPLPWFKAVHRTKNRELLGKPGHANKRKTRHHHPWYLSPCINLWNVLMNTLQSCTVSQIFKTYFNQQAINPRPRPSSSPMEALNTGTTEIEAEGQEPERGKRFLMLLIPHLPLTICLRDLLPHIITTWFLCCKSWENLKLFMGL